PIGGWPNVGNSRQGQLTLIERDFDTQILIPIERQQMIDHGEIARGLALTMRSHTLINRGEVVEHFVRPVHVVLQVPEQSMNRLLLDPKGWDTIAGLLKHSSGPEP